MRVLQEHDAFSDLPQSLVLAPEPTQGDASAQPGSSSGGGMAGAGEAPLLGDVEAPVMARERQQGQRQDMDKMVGQEARRIGGKQQHRPAAAGVEATREQERERARVMVERGNEAITAGNFDNAAAQFLNAHELLKKVEGSKSPAASKTKALAMAMRRKAAQLQQARAAAPASHSQGGEPQGASSDAAAAAGAWAAGGREAGAAKQEAALQQHNMALPRRGALPHAGVPALQAAGRSGGQAPQAYGSMELPDDTDTLMHMSHSLANAPPPPPEACATDEPPRDGEDPERAAARSRRPPLPLSGLPPALPASASPLDCHLCPLCLQSVLPPAFLVSVGVG